MLEPGFSMKMGLNINIYLLLLLFIIKGIQTHLAIVEPLQLFFIFPETPRCMLCRMVPRVSAVARDDCIHDKDELCTV